ncbi:MAG TPA: PfkB family carbohydrate kinase, partial [Phenylobacterium sp.]
MPLALILSSFVAAGRIGGAAQQYVLAAHKIDPVLVPTVMLGRSPAQGAQGQVTSPELFSRILADVEADALFGLVDLVITGHFSLAEQVTIAAGALARVRAASTRRPVIVVDPIMGDSPKGLYVKPEVARAVADELVPLADWITPNLWELGRLTGGEIGDTADAIAAARKLGKPALITSAPAPEGEIGLIYVDADSATLFAHPRHPHAPNGTGDLVTASFGAGLVEGLHPLLAAERAARAVAEAVQAC